MNENLDLTKILKNVTAGTKFWSEYDGVCTFIKVGNPADYFQLDDGIDPSDYPIICREGFFTKEGSIYTSDEDVDAECVLFPSETNHDWSTFNVPTNKKKDKNSNFQELIKNDIINNLKIKITSDYNGYVEAKLLYNGEVISEDTCQINTDYNSLNE